MKNNCLPLAFLTLVAFVSCHQNPSVAFDDQVSLAGADTLVFPWMIPRIITAKPSFSLKIMEKNICLSKMIEREGSPVL